MLTGGCLCGAVRYEVTEPPVAAGYCHCTRCQRRTGSAAACSAALVPGSLRVTSGEELIRSWDPPDGFSKAYCSACGGALWATNGESYAVRMGTSTSMVASWVFVAMGGRATPKGASVTPSS